MKSRSKLSTRFVVCVCVHTHAQSSMRKVCPREYYTVQRQNSSLASQHVVCSLRISKNVFIYTPTHAVINALSYILFICLLSFCHRHSRFGGTFTVMSKKGIADNPMIYHRPLPGD